MITPHTLNIRFSRSRLLWLGIITSLGIASGIVPDLSQHNAGMFTSSASAQSFDDGMLKGYATALMQIEPIRKATLSQVAQANGGNLPNLVCNQPETMEGLNGEAKSLFINYCNQCRAIAESNGLSLDRFNEITQNIRSNRQLKNRIMNFMK
jgi:uncharacterized protein YllA (UPF0747 family)